MSGPLPIAKLRRRLRAGMVIPAHPLALTAARRLDERRQRALTRYYLDAGAGGVAVGVHTTQFAVRGAGLHAPVLALAAEVTDGWPPERGRPRRRAVRIAGIVGGIRQAVREARLAADLGYDAGLLSLGALPKAGVPRLLSHVQAVAEIIPVFGFYLQPAVGGRPLDEAFWRRFAEVERVVAIKIAPFDRYRTLDVMRAVAASGRARDIALYTGNDDHILLDLLTVLRPSTAGRARPGASARRRTRTVPVGMVGGLLGQWAVWTRRAVELHARCRRVARRGGAMPASLLALAAQLTDANAAIFDAAHGFAGCIAGIHEVLRRQGLLAGRWCLHPREDLSPGQAQAITRVCTAYPHLTDDAFVEEHRDRWLR